MKNISLVQSKTKKSTQKNGALGPRCTVYSYSNFSVQFAAQTSISMWVITGNLRKNNGF